MTTKEQERKALEKIRQILEPFGEDSYIGSAFAGCLIDAEQNIENDWLLSMHGRWQDADRKLGKLREDLERANRNNDKLRERAEEAERIANNKIESADKWCMRYHEEHDKLAEALVDVALRDAEIERLTDDTVRLKAKLYDLMTAGA